MSLRITRTFCFLFLTLAIFLPAIATAANSSRAAQYHTLAPSADFPTVDPNYIYQQLFYMATNYQRREAGYDNNLPVTVNGHDEFATYWTQEIEKNLQGFGPQMHHDTFQVAGWLNRPATVPAFNVEVSVPGVTHPEQVVIIGCHYDGETSSTQSANDDASGCAIELGVAKAIGDYWRSHHVYPARTLRFVLFDAEEQGLLGSFHYLNSTVNGDVSNIVAMFNEEQNGIAYPLRFLGKQSNPLLPFNIDMSPLQSSQLYPMQSSLSQQQRDNITHFRALMAQAVPAVFAQFRAMGDQALTYHSDNNQDIPQSIFTPDQQINVLQSDDTLGGSDQIPFTLAGLPCATFAGNSSYYDPSPPPESYPYDQPQDTIQLMNTYADGGSQQSQALTLALGLPGMLTTWMLNQPDILGQIASDGKPIATISDVGQTVAGQPLSLNASASFDPIATGSSTFNYAWDFGDGTSAKGVSVSHTYTAGTYTLTLTVTSSTSTRTISKTLNVVARSTTYVNPYAGFPQDGFPPHNRAVTFPTPNDQLTDKVSLDASTGSTTPTGSGSPAPAPSTGSSGLPIGLLIGIAIGLLGVLLLLFIFIRLARVRGR